MLIKIDAPPSVRLDLQGLVQIFRGRIVDVSPDQVMVEIAGQEKKIEAFIEAVRPMGSANSPGPAGSPSSAAAGPKTARNPSTRSRSTTPRPSWGIQAFDRNRGGPRMDERGASTARDYGLVAFQRFDEAEFLASEFRDAGVI